MRSMLVEVVRMGLKTPYQVKGAPQAKQRNHERVGRWTGRDRMQKSQPSSLLKSSLDLSSSSCLRFSSSGLASPVPKDFKHHNHLIWNRLRITTRTPYGNTSVYAVYVYATEVHCEEGDQTQRATASAGSEIRLIEFERTSFESKRSRHRARRRPSIPSELTSAIRRACRSRISRSRHWRRTGVRSFSQGKPRFEWTRSDAYRIRARQLELPSHSGITATPFVTCGGTPYCDDTLAVWLSSRHCLPSLSAPVERATPRLVRD
jgi:hypothetical protein